MACLERSSADCEKTEAITEKGSGLQLDSGIVETADRKGERETAMPAKNYGADTDDGYRIDDPSPEAIAVLIAELHPVDNTFVTIQPDGGFPAWCASVTLVGDDLYEIEYREHGERRLTTYAEPEEVLDDLIEWLDTRSAPTSAPGLRDSAPSTPRPTATFEEGPGSA
jgi:hypothetical protein